ncbi:MAG TPA: DUF481 domain-containing protein [Bdellovibrionota bacterium]|nr:DUF481 domain-containing protein [Bdellovibrionota bacterium]
MRDWALALIFILGVGTAFAQETPAPVPVAAEVAAVLPAPPPKVETWKANAGASAILNTGNSSNQTLGGNGLASYKHERDKMTFKANGTYGRAEDSLGVTTTNTKNWRTELRYDRYLLDPLSTFALGHLGSDEPAGFDHRYGGAGGLSHEFYKTGPHFSKYEVGFDYTRELRTAPPDENIYSGRLFLQYKLTMTPWLTFGQDFENLFNVQDGHDYRLNTLTALTTKMSDKIAFQVSFSVKFDNVPVPGKKKTDTLTQLGLVVDFM